MGVDEVTEDRDPDGFCGLFSAPCRVHLLERGIHSELQVYYLYYILRGGNINSSESEALMRINSDDSCHQMTLLLMAAYPSFFVENVSRPLFSNEYMALNIVIRGLQCLEENFQPTDVVNILISPKALCTLRDKIASQSKTDKAVIRRLDEFLMKYKCASSKSSSSELLSADFGALHSRITNIVAGRSH